MTIEWRYVIILVLKKLTPLPLILDYIFIKKVKNLKKEDFIDIFPSFIFEYLNYTAVIKNRSDLTVIEYANDLYTFFRFLKQVRGLVSKDVPFEEIEINDLTLEDVSTVTLNDAYMFLVYCKDSRDNNERTRARKATTLRMFYKYLTVQKRLLNENPLQELDSPKIKKTLPKYLTLDESLDLLNSVVFRMFFLIVENRYKHLHFFSILSLGFNYKIKL